MASAGLALPSYLTRVDLPVGCNVPLATKIFFFQTVAFSIVARWETIAHRCSNRGTQIVSRVSRKAIIRIYNFSKHSEHFPEPKVITDRRNGWILKYILSFFSLSSRAPSRNTDVLKSFLHAVVIRVTNVSSPILESGTRMPDR